MPSFRYLLPLLFVAGVFRVQAAHAQVVKSPVEVPPDTAATDVDDEGVRLGLQYGLAGGALQYGAGRTEQSLGAIFRWAPVRWFSMATTPTVARVKEPTLSAAVKDASRSGLEDLPIEATLSHAFGGSLAPTLSGGVGLTLPIADTTGGFGAGSVGYSVSIGGGFSPLPSLWTHVGVGRSLSGLSPQAAFGGGSAWGDVSAGFSFTDRVSVSAGYDTDLGSVDATIGRSTSMSGGLAVAVHGETTVLVSANHGLSGSAPVWGLVIGVGTAFPYLNHAGGSASDQLRQAFGSGSHGSGSGSGGSSGPGRGRP
jgi:hypothetical protein